MRIDFNRLCSCVGICILAAALFANAAVSEPVSPPLKVFRGTYQGNCTFTALNGRWTIYDVVEFEISKKGRIHGMVSITDYSSDYSQSEKSTAVIMGRVKNPKSIVLSPRDKQISARLNITLDNGAKISGSISYFNLRSQAFKATEVNSVTARSKNGVVGNCSILKF